MEQVFYQRCFQMKCQQFLQKVFVSFFCLSLAQQMANLCELVLCSKYLTPAFVPGEWVGLSVPVYLLQNKIIITELITKDGEL